MARGKKKSSKKLGKGEKWVTINGTPVLLGADGKLKGKVGKKIMADRFKNRGKQSGKGYSSEDARMDRERKKELAAIQKAMNKQVAGAPDDYDKRQDKAANKAAKKQKQWQADRIVESYYGFALNEKRNRGGFETEQYKSYVKTATDEVPNASNKQLKRMAKLKNTPFEIAQAARMELVKRDNDKYYADDEKRAAKVKPPVRETRAVRLAREQAERYKPGTVGHERFDSFYRLQEARAREASIREIEELNRKAITASYNLSDAQKKIEKSVRDTAEEFRQTRKAAKQEPEYSDDPVPGGKRAILQGNAAVRRAKKKMQDPEYVRAGEAALTKMHKSIGGIGDHPSVKPKKAKKKATKKKATKKKSPYSMGQKDADFRAADDAGKLEMMKKQRTATARLTGKRRPPSGAEIALRKKVEGAAKKKPAKKKATKKATKKVAKKKTTKKRKSSKPSQAEIAAAMKRLFGGGGV